MFHTAFQEADGDLAIFGKCPEVVRVDNCTAWRPMSCVLETIPRVVHPIDIKTYVGYTCCRTTVALCMWRRSYGAVGRLAD